MNGILDGLLAILGFCYYALLALWAFVSQVLLPVLSIALLVIALLLAVLVLRTLLQPRKYSNYYPEPDPEREQLCAEKLSAMVQVETVSTRGVSEPEKFRRLHAVMRELFPKVFETCEVTDLDGNLLLKWKGKSDKDPIMLMSHLDVVPAGSGWSRDPFGGEIAEGKVWGRGTGDTKGSVMAFYQAVEDLIGEGYVEQILLSCDVCLKTCLRTYGGWGYDHVLTNIVPMMEEAGIDTRIVAGEAGEPHAWNISKLGNNYYYCDFIFIFGRKLFAGCGFDLFYVELSCGGCAHESIYGGTSS